MSLLNSVGFVRQAVGGLANTSNETGQNRHDRRESRGLGAAGDAGVPQAELERQIVVVERRIVSVKRRRGGVG
ncbi:MAG TPA: hypothetical protein VIK41_24645, partial [Gemmatimonadaceae bacterium]